MVEAIKPIITELVNTDIYFFYQASDVIENFLFAMFIELSHTVC